jgi:hypothetical protein
MQIHSMVAQIVEIVTAKGVHSDTLSPSNIWDVVTVIILLAGVGFIAWVAIGLSDTR